MFPRARAIPFKCCWQLSSYASRKLSSGEQRETRVRFKIWNDIWAHLRRMSAVRTGFGVAAALVGISYLAYGAGKKEKILPSFSSSDKAIIQAFSEGRGMDAFQAPDADAKVKRPKLHASLKAVLRPSETKQYVVIVGENGTGKSTAVRQVLSKLEEPKGVVYINCSQYNRFSLQLSRLIGYEAESDIRGGHKTLH
jgi:transcriptional regulator with GAF, ATPase, and Fis domain